MVSFCRNDRLPRAFAERLRDKIVYRAPVVKIIREPRKVHVRFTRDGQAQSLSAEHLICTIPFTVLSDVQITPPLSAEKQRAIDRVRYDSASRVFLQLLAGEHTSAWPSWMQGALEAGNRGALNVHRA